VIGADYKKRDPLYGAALLTVSFELKSGKPDKNAREIIDGVIKDLGVTKEQVRAYIEEHRQELIRTCREKGLI